MNESNHNQKFSVGAFFFLPQFKYSFRWAETLYPVFIQLVASVFVATGLLERNHPAMRYGSSEVKKYSFRDLVGEAWYHLRRTRANPRQWAMYFSVLIMIFCFATAIVGVTSRVFLGLGATAQAQVLFTLPAGPNCAGSCNTSIQNGMSPSPSIFDKRMDRSQTGTDYNDWGLFMLDKIVRESAQTPAVGGSLQNAFSAVILTYNSAITVIAAVMIFWIILSVVVDTAKTGILGGGRHNMVWAPIRIVFALGMMIPLGSAGYSSGQYCVMKLAEWGSNLGTNGWNQYIANVVGANDLLAPVLPGGYAGLVNDIAQMRLCQVTYNSYVVKSTDSADWPNQLIGARNTWSDGGSTLTHALTNTQDASLCGALKISAPGGNADVVGGGAFAGWSYSPGGMGTVPQRWQDTWTGAAVPGDDTTLVGMAYMAASLSPLGAGPLGSSWVTPLGSNPLSQDAGAQSFQAAAAFMRQVMITRTIKDMTTKVEPKMLEFACAYAGHHVVGGSTIVNQAVDANESTSPPGVLGTLCNGGWTDTGCGAKVIPAGSAPNNYDPDYSCHGAAIAAMEGSAGANISAAVAQMLTWIGSGPTSSFNKDMMAYGWASAGAFYNKITEMNASAQALAQPAITFLPGKLGYAASECNGPSASKRDCDPTGINYETAMVMQGYTRWYEEYSASSAGYTASGAGAGGSCPSGTCSGASGMGGQGLSADKPNGMSMWKIGWSLLTGGASAVSSLISTLFEGPNSRNSLMVNLVGSYNDNTLPLANLAKTGIGLTVTGGTILLLCSLLQGAVGAIPLAGVAIANSAIFAFVTSAAASLITTGTMLTFFVPIMPFIRAAFATLTWMVSIFEAVCMVPIAALAHLTTEGEGLAAGARVCWILWLNVLTRPILFVMGFIGAFIVYNAFICYFTTAFTAAAATSPTADNVVLSIIALMFNTTVYVGTCYAAANAVFKMVDIIPNALMRWMPGGSVDHSFDGDGASGAQGYAQSAASTISRGQAAFTNDAGRMAGYAIQPKPGAGLSAANWPSGGGSGGAGGGGSGGGIPTGSSIPTGPA